MNIDYGCQRVLIYVANPELAGIIHNDVETTICFPPANFPGVDLFTLGLGMRNRAQAKRLAEILHVWSKSADQGEGIFLAILRNKKGFHRLQLGPDLQVLQDRLTNTYTSKFIKSMGFGTFPSKGFDDIDGGPSRNFPIFLERWTGQPIRLTMFVAAYPYPVEVPGTRIDNVPLHVFDTEKNTYMPGEDAATPDGPEELDHSADIVSSRRSFALRRYFPVTMTRLASNPEFIVLSQHLQAEGFSHWQILQGACNLTLRGRFQDHSEARSALNERDHASVIQALERHPESVTQPLPKLTLIKLRNQILGDVRDFHQNVTRDKGLSSAQIQAWLQSSEFRDADLHSPPMVDWSFR
ncbi:hypothetical protein [Deinococcus radiotolerans]|uniref:Uncharacterized protein n=1 Tax=Deinococcus radiotolerans TaxID=1309407 RepID=A0ABQ2FQQ0_9DEIO|nr:hypothetical protein [Deinococcus radiotolerans]GGL17499.1 hypothetical protein GCM10010844_40410 [Deinococcus radiotolerans]